MNEIRILLEKFEEEPYADGLVWYESDRAAYRATIQVKDSTGNWVNVEVVPSQ